MTKFRLGLDLGTNSIGWCLLNLDTNGDPVSIFKTGVRIFSDGRDPKKSSSLKATRRAARSTRRRRDRFIQRQKYLINELVKLGLMPSDKVARQALAFKDPYAIRKKALDEQVSPFDMGRAIFHLNQRRGFKSNRKSADGEAGVVKSSIKDFEEKLEEKKARTIGEFLADRHKNKDTVRARRFGKKDEDLYEFYPDRSMLEHEFDMLWAAQAGFNPGLYTIEAGKNLKNVVFFQRALKPQEVGQCFFEPKEKRIAKALPSFQRFRIYQELSNLAWIDKDDVNHPVTSTPKLRDRLFDELEKKQKLKFTSMHTILRKEGIVDYPFVFNLESDQRDHLLGNTTSCMMRSEKKKKKMLGTAWDEFDKEKQDALILLLLNEEMDDDAVKASLINDYGLSPDVAEACLDARLPDGHGSLSKKAIDKILPIIRDEGLKYDKAVEKAGYGKANRYDPNVPLSPNLDYYGKALAGHVMGASGKEEDTDEKRYGTISNPTVHIALNQIRAVVNELIRLYGKPEEVALEIGRDLPMGADSKSKLQKSQQKGIKKNERAREKLAELGHIDSRKSRQKFQLWEQLSQDPTDRRCPFTGRVISISDLFSNKIEIDHLLPFSATLDDSLSNMIVCYREANQKKGNQSPYEAFGSSPDGYDWQEILERAKSLPMPKYERFLSNAMEKFEEEGGFLARHLNDTKYISRYTAEYIATVISQEKIWVVTGRLTSLLRHSWGLNSVLRGHNSEDGQTTSKKNRHDHRHHTVDAIVVAMTSRRMLQRVSTAARRPEKLNIKRLFDNRIDPWDGFRDEVKEHIGNIIVSHRPRKKNQGPLHNDTAYGIVEHVEEGASRVVHRVPVVSLKKSSHIEKVRDSIIKSALLNETADLSGKPFEEAVQQWCAMNGIKSLRIIDALSVIPIKDKSGNIYKWYKGDSNAYMEIYTDPATGKWKSEIISRFDANQKNFIPNWRVNNPTTKLNMRLRINDLIKFKDNDEIYRIQKMSQGSVTLAPHTEANVDARNKDKNDPFKFTSASASVLEKCSAARINISPTGLISEA